MRNKKMEILTKKKKLKAYKHYDFWQCIDTKRDRDMLEEKLRKKLRN